MTKKEMLADIYKAIANKTLSFGCRIENKNWDPYEDWIVTKFIALGSSSSDWYDEYIKFPNKNRMVFSDFRTGELNYLDMFRNPFKYDFKEWESCSRETIEKYYNIIGHPVMLGDVLDWVDKKLKWVYKDKSIMSEMDRVFQYLPQYWGLRRWPIDEQDEPTIKFVRDLLPKNT